MGTHPWSRRRFLGAAAAAATAPLVAPLLASCSSERPSEGDPGVLPLHDDLLIAADAPIERGATLRIYEWRDYLDHDVVRGFVRRHADAGIDVHIDSFTSMPEAVARLQRPGPGYDIFFPAIDVLPGMVQDGLLRPLQHAALPHLSSLWPFFTDPARPFYDVGQRYTVPYTVYSTGIGWRRDLVSSHQAPDRLADPYDAFWEGGLRGEVGLVDDYREPIAMALLRRGADPNDASEAEVRAAVDDLVGLASDGEVGISIDGAYEGLQTGEYAIQQAWSGDVMAAKRFGSGTAATLARTDYTWPRDGVVGCDLMAVCATGEHPALAHAFIDHMLQEEVALANFAWNGYQPPVLLATRASFEDPAFPWRDLVPTHLLGALLDPDDLLTGRFLRPLPIERDAIWRDGWDRIRSEVGED